MYKEKVSIITPNYNGSRFLNETIESVLKQTYTNWELIIVDDGSTDNSKEIVSSYNDDRISYFNRSEFSRKWKLY